jgi:hypothetical protein
LPGQIKMGLEVSSSVAADAACLCLYR